MRASRACHVLTLSLSLWACNMLVTAYAQVVVISAAVGTAGAGNTATASINGGVASSFTVALRDVRVGTTTVGVAIGHGYGGRRLATGAGAAVAGTGALQLDTTLAANHTFGPLGNVIVELAGSVRTDAAAQGVLSVRGTIGPVAARVGLSAFTDDAVLFSTLAMAADDRPSLGRAGVGVAVGVTARFGRNVILDVEPDFYLTSAGLTARLESRLRRLRTFGDNELRLYLVGAALPAAAGAAASTADWHAAVGAGVLWPRGRAPDIEVAAFLGTRGASVIPGLRVSLAESLAGGTRLALEGSLEPYRVDVHPLRVRADLTLPVAGGTLGFAVVGAALDASRQATFALQTSFSTAVKLP